MAESWGSLIGVLRRGLGAVERDGQLCRTFMLDHRTGEVDLRMVGDCWPVAVALEGRRVLVGGLMTRDIDGRCTLIVVDHIEALPDDAGPTVDELVGSAPDLTGGLSAVEFVRRQRHG